MTVSNGNDTIYTYKKSGVKLILGLLEHAVLH